MKAAGGLETGRTHTRPCKTRGEAEVSKVGLGNKDTLNNKTPTLKMGKKLHGEADEKMLSSLPIREINKN